MRLGNESCKENQLEGAMRYRKGEKERHEILIDFLAFCRLNATFFKNFLVELVYFVGIN